jgi:RNA polymerase sigma-70 factor, ECF subfamily
MPRAGVAAIRTETGGERGRGPAVGGLDERALVAEVAAGHEPAFRVLIGRHLPSVTAIARRMLRDDAEAEDVAQEAFLRLWRLGASLDVGTAGVKPWLRRVVSNLCIDRMRSGARTTVTDEVPEQREEARQLEGLEDAELSGRVDQALKQLPERQRLALTLFHFEGLSQNEIAHAMDISDDAVESLLARARRQLKMTLKNEWTALTNDGAH